MGSLPLVASVQMPTLTVLENMRKDFDKEKSVSRGNTTSMFEANRHNFRHSCNQLALFKATQLPYNRLFL